MAGPKDKPGGKRIAEFTNDDLRSFITKGGKRAQRARNELTKRGQPLVVETATEE